ncbi:FeS assembly protein SufD [Hyphomicrobium nitrativorans NL23]|uniref:FeS assembly protein SufD n=1 Tax=Hyphomicrobium nitrativorans NL23 TaxID=1029756 RepID=V5SHM5_9HYPH|nr:Fe-S cluster assembly protein SufD [Hyphomicrobium nitrativorans]AHB49444.1 FeS assembly protein SufD [Hyphomicrobium nitrativorans NL23]
MSIAQKIETGATGRGGASVQALKTKAETALVEAFTNAEPSLPGGTWLRALRKDAIGAFTGRGLPHRRVEEWKYTDVRAFMREAFPLTPDVVPDAQSAKALIEAALPGADLSGTHALFFDGSAVSEAGISAVSEIESAFLARIIDHPPAWLQEDVAEVSGHVNEATRALNTALFTDGAVLDIAEDREIATPIALIFASGSDAAGSVATRNVIRVGKNAKVTIVEVHAAPDAPRQVNTLTQLIVGDGAEVVHVKLVASREGSIHLGRTIARLGADANYRPFQMVLGDGVVRNDLAIAFRGEHTTFDLGCALLGNAGSHHDITMVVDHAVPNCTSRELVKTVLRDRSRAVFQGKVIVRPDAQKTDGKQMAQALMLSPDTEFNSKPELEIYADDVVCGHGSTSAEIDPDLVFYLQSRGIPLEEAQAMLVESFVGEAIDKAEPEAVQDALRALARGWLQSQA